MPNPETARAGASPATLSNLPAETIVQIAGYLLHTDLISLALVSPAIFRATEKLVWSETNFEVQPNFGRYPYTVPAMIAVEGYDLYARQVEWEADDRRVDRVREKKDAGPESAASSMSGVAPRFLSPSLESLEIEPPFDNGVPTSPFDAFELKFFDCGISFTSLSYLRIGRLSITYAEFVPFIVSLAPNLVELDVDFNSYRTGDWSFDHIPNFPQLWTKTKLIRLRLAMPEHPYGSDGFDSDSLALFGIMEYSPRLQQCVLQYREYTAKTADLLLRSFAHQPPGESAYPHPNLRDLYWTVRRDRFMQFLDPRTPLEPLRRLVINSDRGTDVLLSVPFIPNLEILCFVQTLAEPLKSRQYADAQPVAPVAQVMLPTLARRLRRAPHLRAIHTIQDDGTLGHLDIFRRLDEIESSNGFTGEVRSYRHGEEELLHLRLLLNDHCVSDELSTQDDDPIPSSGRTVLHYRIRGMSTRCRVLERRDYASWQYFTEYHGRVVPLEVLEEMRLVEGATEEEWNKRGVQVGDAAWAVLKKWEQSDLADSASGGRGEQEDEGSEGAEEAESE